MASCTFFRSITISESIILPTLKLNIRDGEPSRYQIRFDSSWIFSYGASTCSWITLSIMTFSIMTLSIMTFSIMTPIKMIISTMTPSLVTLISYHYIVLLWSRIHLKWIKSPLLLGQNYLSQSHFEDDSSPYISWSGSWIWISHTFVLFKNVTFWWIDYWETWLRSDNMSCYYAHNNDAQHNDIQHNGSVVCWV